MSKKPLLFIGVFLALFLSATVTQAAGNTIVVNSNLGYVNADGFCSLVEAINNSNSGTDMSSGDCVSGTADVDTITFTSGMTILPTSQMSITKAVIIDARSTGTCAAPGVIIDGSTAGSTPFLITGVSAGGTQFSGFKIRSYTGSGIEIRQVSGSQTIISCNQIGLNDAGTAAAGSNQSIYIIDSSNLLIGGPTAADRNTFSGNQDSIYNQGLSFANGTGQTHDIIIEGNYFGVDAAGLVPVPNGTGGQGQGIGFYNDPGFSNITIRNNLFAGGGVAVDSSTSVSNMTITGNTFEIASDGVAVLPTTGTHEETGLKLTNVTNVTIGSTSSPNVFGTAGDKRAIKIDSADGVTIVANRIGYLADGTTPATRDGGNTRGNITLENSQNITIGGSNVNEGNIINADSLTAGAIFVDDSGLVTILGNRIGIDKNDTLSASTGFYGIAISMPSGLVTVGGTGTYEKNFFAKIQYGIYNLPSAAGRVVINHNTFSNLNYGIAVGTTSLAPGIGSYAAILRNSITALVLPIVFTRDTNGDQIPDADLTPRANDTLDADTGANDLLNRPVLISAVQSGGDTVVTYMLDVPVSAKPYRVEFFTNPSKVLASGLGNTEVYAGYDTQTISSAGPQVFSVTLSGVNASDTIAATVTSCTNGGCTTYSATSQVSNSTEVGVDLGTATGTQTALADNGPYHLIGSDTFLGVKVSPDTISSIDTDDKDGVTFDAGTYVPSASATITVTAGASGYLHGWFDANGDGDFNDTDEHFADNDAVSVGTSQYTLTLPSSDGSYALRLRLTSYSASGLLPTGEALDGEVEDYTITVATPVVAVSGGIVAVFGCNDKTATNYNPNTTVNSGCIYVTGVKPTSSTSSTQATVFKFTKTLKFGMNDPEVKELQRYLNTHGYPIATKGFGALGFETNYFGKLTQKALIAYQEANKDAILKPYKLTKGTGIFGPATRAAFAK